LIAFRLPRINLKLGGINVIVDHAGLTVPGTVPLLGDLKNATVVMGEHRSSATSY
jgi:hypothetical protein